MFDLLRRKTNGIRADALDFAVQLVRIPSLTSEETELAAFVKKTMLMLGYDKVIQDDCGNVVGVLLGRNPNPVVLLNTHMDTVTPGNLSAWKDSPTSGLIRDGRLFGLGASDCKSGIAAQVFAGALLKRSLLPLEGSVVVAVTVAEETGLSAGVQFLMDKTLPSMDISPDFAILGEPTDLGLYYGHDGWVELDVSVYGINPFQVSDATRAVIKELSLDGRRTKIGSGTKDMTFGRPAFHSANGYHCVSLPLNRKTQISENAHDVLTKIQHDARLAAKSAGHAAVSVEIPTVSQDLHHHTIVKERTVEAWSTDPFDPVLESARYALSAAGSPVRTGKWSLPHRGMATAGGILTRKYGIPTIGYGPGTEEKAHSPNESVPTASLIEAVHGTAVIVHRLVGVPVWGWCTEEV